MQRSLTDRLVRIEQSTVDRTRRKDGEWQTTEKRGNDTRGGQEETREANADMGGLC